jgi:hypothetical protein
MLSKLLSGRFLLTVTAAVVFAVLSISGRIDAKDVMAIIIMVFTLYFTRTDRQSKGGQNV